MKRTINADILLKMKHTFWSFFSLFLAVLSLVAIIIVYAKYDIAVIALGNHLTVSIVYILWTVFYTTIFPIV